MPVIKPTCLRDLKLRVNLADVVSRTVALRKAGARMVGLCPFHQEKTPSFNVDPDKGFYKCFGCGKSGDVISFVQETEQLGFVEAVETLGQRFGIVIEYEAGAGPSREERSLRQEIFDLHELAAEHYHQAFKAQDETGRFMRQYWTEQRQFSPALADEFKIGAAPAAADGLGAALLRRKFSEDALRRCGLFFVRDGAALTLGALRPRFRGRLMIPIRDHQGRTVGFTARQTALTPADDPSHDAKYINSPETPVFIKGHLLFNLDRARTAVSDDNPFVLVEGQLDAMRCWSVGLKTAVAPQGTAITDTQLVLIRRYLSRVECLFDSDEAGRKAALRFLPLALKAGLEVRFLQLSGAEKLDPDALFLARGLAAYAGLRDQSLSAMQLAQRAILPQPETCSAEQKGRAAREVLAIINHADSQVVRGELVEEAARLLQINVSSFHADAGSWNHSPGFQARRPDPPAGSRAAGTPAPARGLPPPSPEQHLLLLCLHHPAMGKSLSAALPHDWVDTSTAAGVLLNRFLAEFEHDNWPGADQLDPLLASDAEKQLVASLLFEPPAFDDPQKIAREGFTLLRKRALEPRLRQIELALANTHADSNADPISLLKERSEILHLLKQPPAIPAMT